MPGLAYFYHCLFWRATRLAISDGAGLLRRATRASGKGGRCRRPLRKVVCRLPKDRQNAKRKAAAGSGSRRGRSSSSRPGRLATRTMTRDWGLLVKDQDILDLVNSTRIDRTEELAGRFDAIASIIGTERGDIRSLDSALDEDSPDAAAKEGKPRAIAPAVRSGTTSSARVRAKIREIERIGRESRARRFREIVSAIIQGLAAGDVWSARHTARAVVAETFANTPAYFQALDQFCCVVRALRER